MLVHALRVRLRSELKVVRFGVVIVIVASPRAAPPASPITPFDAALGTGLQVAGGQKSGESHRHALWSCSSFSFGRRHSIGPGGPAVSRPDSIEVRARTGKRAAGTRRFREVTRRPSCSDRERHGAAQCGYAVARGSGALWRGIAWRISLAVLYLPMGMMWMPPGEPGDPGRELPGDRRAPRLFRAPARARPRARMRSWMACGHDDARDLVGEEQGLLERAAGGSGR